MKQTEAVFPASPDSYFILHPSSFQGGPMRTLTEIFQTLPADPEKGLPLEGVAASRQRYGENRLTPMPREPLWKKFLEKFDEPIIKILLAAALLSMVVDLFKYDKANNGLLGGIGLGLIVIALVAAFAARLQQWIPSIMFASAMVLFFLG